MRRAAYAGALAIALTLVAGASGTSQSTGTLQLKAKFSVKWHFLPACPAGQPSNVTCYSFDGQAVVPGLGRVTARYMKTFDGACARTPPDFVLTVAGKGDVSGTVTGPACGAVPPTQVTLDVTISGGTGTYAGASGSIQITSAIFERSAGVGVATDTYSGTLNVSGLEFDVTAPVLRGAHSMTVRAPKGARRVKVRYAVSAHDAVDGSEHAACKPSSGARFTIGRTRVTCTAMDSSANSGTARFTVTVKPTR
jgi:hypothetical protein